MRKRIGGAAAQGAGREAERGWLELEQIATVEVSSEDPGFPVESVFTSQAGPGWRAADSGEQRIRLIFDYPVTLRRIRLRFDEAEFERTQEFTLRWSSAAGSSREVVRQQWNFSPAGATTEIEDYTVDLDGVSVLELTIQPDIGRRRAAASLTSWRVA
jgi:hypothetical protein